MPSIGCSFFSANSKIKRNRIVIEDCNDIDNINLYYFLYYFNYTDNNINKDNCNNIDNNIDNKININNCILIENKIKIYTQLQQHL